MAQIPSLTELRFRAAALQELLDGPDEMKLTYYDLAGWWGVSIRWLEDAVRWGYGPPAIREGRRVHFTLGQAKAYLRELEAKAERERSARRAAAESLEAAE